MQIYLPHYLTSLGQGEVPPEIVVETIPAEETAPGEVTTAVRDLMRVANAFPGVPPENILRMLIAMEDFPTLDRHEISRITPENTGYSKIIGLFIYLSISLISLSFFEETISIF